MRLRLTWVLEFCLSQDRGEARTCGATQTCRASEPQSDMLDLQKHQMCATINAALALLTARRSLEKQITVSTLGTQMQYFVK